MARQVSWAERYMVERHERAREAEEGRRGRKRARAQARKTKAAKRRAAGKVVQVRAYCRRGANRYTRGDEGMPF